MAKHQNTTKQHPQEPTTYSPWETCFKFRDTKERKWKDGKGDIKQARQSKPLTGALRREKQVGSLRSQGQLGLHSRCQACQGQTERPCHKNSKGTTSKAKPRKYGSSCRPNIQKKRLKDKKIVSGRNTAIHSGTCWSPHHSEGCSKGGGYRTEAIAMMDIHAPYNTVNNAATENTVKS